MRAGPWRCLCAALALWALTPLARARDSGEPVVSLAAGPWESAELEDVHGARIALRASLLAELRSTIALSWLDRDSELLFVGDAETRDASRPSRRYGIELASSYAPNEWLSIDACLSFTRARFRDSDLAGDRIPGSPETVIEAGVAARDLAGFLGAVRLRYLGPRPLVEDDSVRSSSQLLLSAHARYPLGEAWTLRVDAFRRLGRGDRELGYFYASRLRDVGGRFGDLGFHPVVPTSVRVGVTAAF